MMYKTASRYSSAINASSGHSGWSAGLHVSSQQGLLYIFIVYEVRKVSSYGTHFKEFFYESYLLGAGIHTKLLR